MPLTIIHSNRFLDHVTPPGHPERVERGEVMKTVAESWARRAGSVKAPRDATREELGRVHSPAHLRRIDDAASRAVSFDPDTYTSPDSRDVAVLAAGAAVTAVESIINSRGARAMALVRPPGHHAEANRAMGFCLYNNVAVAAAHALTLGLERVAVVDYDVHHGNGTQWMFYEDPRVLYVSTHQYPFYPGTGAAEEVGRGRGAGFTLNVPLEAGATDGDYREVFSTLVIPALDQFKPEVILISAGYDAHEDDPLARMRLSTHGYAVLTDMLCGAADRHCQGRIAAVTEGGYDLDALRSCLDAAIGVLNGSGLPPRPRDVLQSTMRSRLAIAAVRSAHARYWRL